MHSWLLRLQWTVWLALILMTAACGGASAPGPAAGRSGGSAPTAAASPTRRAGAEASPAPSAAPPTATAVRPAPTSKAGLPQRLAGELRYTEHYKSTTTVGPQASHTIEGLMHLKLKIDPEQSDESKTVWSDDGGTWNLKGGGGQTATPCTNIVETYDGYGTFQNWDPSKPGTGIVQVTVFKEPANQPPMLTFSVVARIVSIGTAGQLPGGGCKPFNASNWWPFPTSMAGGMLQGTLDRSGGIYSLIFSMQPDVNAQDAFADEAGARLDGKP